MCIRLCKKRNLENVKYIIYRFFIIMYEKLLISANRLGSKECCSLFCMYEKLVSANRLGSKECCLLFCMYEQLKMSANRLGPKECCSLFC